MRYQFEIKEKIIDCSECPFYDPLIDENNIFAEHEWECWINKKPLDDISSTKPEWCPLEELEQL